MNSRVFLVGTATYLHGLPAMPCAYANVADMSDALTGAGGVFDPSAVDRIVDPASGSLVLDRIRAVAMNRFDVLLFYFAGHGLRDREGELYLGLPGSVDNHEDTRRTSLSVRDVFETLKGCAAKRRVAIIDCCYSGLALDLAGTNDTHVVAATNRVTRAHFAETERNTKFTDALLCLMNQGIPEGPEYIDLASAYRRVAVMLNAAQLPVPSQCVVNTSAELALARNVAHGSARSRAGLRARARFAQQVAASRWSAHAVHLWDGIASDGTDEYSGRDLEVLRYRHAHATSTGVAGHPAQAVDLLREIVADLSVTVAEHTPALRDARVSLEYWLAEHHNNVNGR